jgi:hypothetical protein
MTRRLRPALFIALLAAAGCEVTDSNLSFAENIAVNACIRAVERETGVNGASLNTTLAVVEVNQYIIDVPNARPWTCYTTDSGRPTELTEVRQA